MKGFVDNIEKLTEENTDFRCVLYTGNYLQLVLMSLKPGEEIGAEVHDDRDQFFRVEKGEGEILIDDYRTKVKADDAMIVPAGARHNVVNTGKEPLRLYTLYGPPEHKDKSAKVVNSSWCCIDGDAGKRNVPMSGNSEDCFWPG